MSGREPEAVLDELGARLEHAWQRAPDRPLRDRLRRPGVAIAAVLTLALVPTAVATRDVLWAPDPPPLPPQLRAPDGPRAGDGVYVASGRSGGVPWRLAATACDLGGGRRAVAVFLTVPGGGAGARCDVATVSPRTAATRLVHTYFDPVAGRTWVFGVAPAHAADVRVGGVTAPARAADPRAVAKGRLPRGLRVFATSLPAVADPGAIVIRDGEGEPVARCRDGRCVTAAPAGAKSR